MRKLIATIAATLTLVGIATASTTSPADASDFGYYKRPYFRYDDTLVY